MENIRYDIWLNTLNGIGPYLVRNLLEHFTRSENIYHASLNALTQVAGVGLKTATLILENKGLEDAKRLMDYCACNDILIISSSSPLYPPILHQYPKAPTLLYVRGDLNPLLFMETAAIVGARRCSSYGKEATTALANHLSSQNIAVISGMAKGIDSYAHTATIKSGGYTVAVLGTGPERCYPSEHQELMNRIIETGAVISQFPPGSKVPKQNFIKRNRLVAILSNQIYVMEATKTSGALYTAECGFDYNKEVFALPGNIYDPLSEGSNHLIAKGAKIYLPPLVSPTSTLAVTASCDNPIAKAIIALLGRSSLHIETINKQLKFEHEQIQETLFTLELEGQVECSGGMVRRLLL